MTLSSYSDSVDRPTEFLCCQRTVTVVVYVVYCHYRALDTIFIESPILKCLLKNPDLLKGLSLISVLGSIGDQTGHVSSITLFQQTFQFQSFFSPLFGDFFFHENRVCLYFLRTDSTKINRPGYNIRMY